jgi:hypothetical protein
MINPTYTKQIITSMGGVLYINKTKRKKKIDELSDNLVNCPIDAKPLTDKDVVAIEIGIDGTEEVGGESELLNNGRASIATTLRTVD